ncbi:PR domain zinc finger protein 5-like [Cloeon dipterum]|uniref:PR domain zinc finger protein 5-like n=1 Tax=Cloeon dipterum TaxID=197152 RepID=UPI00321FABD9
MPEPENETCFFCHYPAVDGGVQASQVDRLKFAEWSLDTLKRESHLQPHHMFCHFCVWDAQVMLKSMVGVQDDNSRLEWWPDDDELGNDVKIKKKYYLEEKIKQCYVHLEKIKVPENRNKEDLKEECIYCHRKYRAMRQHMYDSHRKTAIRCKHSMCSTFYLTVKERDAHMKEFHKPKGENSPRSAKEPRPSKRKKLAFEEQPTDNAPTQNPFACNQCQFSTENESLLEAHLAEVHSPPRLHGETTPNSKPRYTEVSPPGPTCRDCRLSVPLDISKNHYQRVRCKACKAQFPCCGLLAFHRNKCKGFECKKCRRHFKQRYLLDFHVLRTHSVWRGLRFKRLDFKCEPCMRYYKDKQSLEKHLCLMHNKRMRQCAHCTEAFADVKGLALHLADEHDLLHKKYKCSVCKSRYFLKEDLIKHRQVVHSLVLSA